MRGWSERGRKVSVTPITSQTYGNDETPKLCWVLGLAGIEMYRMVYWSGVTLFVVWSVFSAVSALTGY